MKGFELNMLEMEIQTFWHYVQDLTIRTIHVN